MQAALGLAQLKKLAGFVTKRRHNFNRLKQGLLPLNNKIILPEFSENASPSWFGFLITLKPESGLNRNDVVEKLSEAKIATRLLFAGDIRKQPYFSKYPYRVSGEMTNTDTILNHTFWVGVTPMINDEMVDYMVETLHTIFK